MSSAFGSESQRLEWERSPEPGWIESPSGPLFAWYHPPRGPVRDRAVLLCDPILSERMNLHLSYRHLALRLAAHGYPALRFDYPGTGDSSGSPRDPGWSAGWSESMGCALDFLLARSGLERAALFGARFGGTLATDFALGRSEVDSLLLWGPFSSGRSFLRDARAMHKLIRSNESGRRPSHFEPGDEEFVGFLLNTESRDHIEGIRLLEGEVAPCARAHIIAWDEYSSEDELAAHFSNLGMRVEFERPEGLDSDTSIADQALPEVVYQRLLAGLERDSELLPEPPGRTHPHPALPDAARVRRSSRDAIEIEERALRFGSDSGVFGILSRPVGSLEKVPAPRIILVSGGNNHRCGINRNYTEWARDAALRGATCLRFDIRGLGDSPPMRSEDLNQLYRAETREDVLGAIDFMSELGPGGRIILCGLCAGAFQALHASLEDERVDVLVLLDLLKWDPDTPSVQARGFLDRRLRQFRRTRDALVRGLGLPDGRRPSSLSRWLDELVERGTKVVAVGCRAGGGFDAFFEAIGGEGSSLIGSGRVRLDEMQDSDHIFSPIWAQEHLAGMLMEMIDAEPDDGLEADSVADG